MLASLLIGLVAGQRAMTPPAALALAAMLDDLPPGAPGARRLAAPLTALGLAILALGEMAGDKVPSAPDRTVPVGLAGRFLTASFAGAVLAPGGRRHAGAAVAGAAAIASSFLGLALRRRGMAAVGRVPSGLAEDAAVILGALIALDLARRG